MSKNQFIPSNQTRGMRLVNSTLINQDNQQVNIDLPRGPHIESCIVRVAGSFAIGTLFAGGVRNGAAYKFLKSGQWVLNSNVTMDSVSGIQLAQTYVTRRNIPLLSNPAAATVGAQSFDVSFIFDRALMDMMRSKDSMLKTDTGVSNNQMRLQLGALSDMFGFGAGAATYTNVVCTTTILDYQEQKGANGDTPKPAFYIKRNGSTTTLASAGAGQQIKINTGNRLRSVSFIVRDATTGEPNPALISRVRIARAGDTRIDTLSTELQRLNQAAYGQALLTGQFVWDFAYTGQLAGVRYSEFWPIPSSADTYLYLDVVGPCIIDMATIEGVDLSSK